jgi:hypothetical protein
MALVTCGRCGKGYSDKVYPACPACGGQPDSKPMRSDYVAPSGRAPGDPPDSGGFWTTGHMIAATAAVVLIGLWLYRLVAPTGARSPEPVAAPSGPVPAAASSPWADRVEAGVQAMTAGDDGMRMAHRIMSVLHGDATRAFLSGASVNKNGREASVDFSIMWFTRNGAACQTSIVWYVSEARGHVQATVVSDSAPYPAGPGSAGALNQHFANSVWPHLSRRMLDVSARLLPSRHRRR